MSQNFTFVILVVILILLTLLISANIFWDKKDKDLTKYTGALLLVLLSICSQSPWVSSVAVFIVGLIIASERFMSFLVAIMKGDSSFLQHSNFVDLIGKMSNEEIKEKQTSELKEINDIERTEDQKEDIIKDKSKEVKKEKIKEKEQKDTVKISKAEYLKKFPEIEKLALEKFQKSCNFEILENIKVDDRLNFDAFGQRKTKKGEIKENLFIEVKVFPDIPLSSNGGYAWDRILRIVSETVNRFLIPLNTLVEKNMRTKKIKHTLFLILVINTDADLTRIHKLVSKVRDSYNQNSFVQVKMIYYNLPRLLKKNTI